MDWETIVEKAQEKRMEKHKRVSTTPRQFFWDAMNIVLKELDDANRIYHADLDYKVISSEHFMIILEKEEINIKLEDVLKRLEKKFFNKISANSLCRVMKEIIEESVKGN